MKPLKIALGLLLTSTSILSSQAQTKENMNSTEKMKAPIARKEAFEITTHGDTRVDNYFWMRLSDEQKEAEQKDAQTEEVVQYLNDENAFLKQEMKHTEEFQDQLFNEIVGRIKQTDESVPVKMNGYLYYHRYEEGIDYAFRCRKKAEEGAEEEIILNEPELAEGHAYFAVGGMSISPDNKLMVYGVDTVSRREYTLYVKNLETGEIFEDRIVGTTGGGTWANDNKTIFYTKKDPVTLRSAFIYKHVLGTDASEDELVYEEKDDTYSCYIYKTKSKKYLMINSHQTEATEYRFLDADQPNGEWKVIEPRKRDHQYYVSHFEDDFYITTNHEAKNFRLMKTNVEKTGLDNWTEIIPHREDVLLESTDIFKNFLVLEERKEGLMNIRIINWSNSQEHYIEFNDPAYLAYTSANPEFDTEILRYGYTSLTTPNSTYDYNMDTKEQTLLKQQEVMDSSFSPNNYQSERIMVEARDGVKVPVSIVYKKGMKKDGENPLLLYAYGSYGSSIDPYFSSVRLSLLDRGFVYAIAHIRGGMELGKHWYEDGKKLKKKNTFTDFIDCGKFLVDQKYTSPNHLYAMGGSAGGLLMGAIMNMEPSLWNGVIAAVPFVDVVSTMLDESIPLTTGEFDEWGNPKDEEYYHYIKSYSPYDNIEEKDYPNTLITTGYWDSQVQYWEPAKWIAKLRDLKTDNKRLFMYCNMDVGHGGASGRFERFRETALEYAFILDLEGITK